VIDLRTVSPWDEQTVLNSVARTGRAVVPTRPFRRFGVGAEIAARIHEELHETLAAPVGRVGSAFCPVPFAMPDGNTAICIPATRSRPPSGPRSARDGHQHPPPRCGHDRGVLVEWLVGDGAAVAAGTPIYRLETDKVENEIEAPTGGTVRLLAEPGETYAVGTTVARIE